MEKLLICIILPVLTSGNDCFTWQFLTKNDLNLNISFTATSKKYLASEEFVLTDHKSNKLAKCMDYNCSLNDNRDTFSYHAELYQYRFIIHRNQASDFDGMWSVIRGDKEYLKAVISYMKGTIDDTQVNFEAFVFLDRHLNIPFLHLTCWSCRVPYGQNAEFLIQNKSEVSVRWDPESNLCYSSSAVCNPTRCNCSQAGNSFDVVFEYVEATRFYSCDMIFTDDLLDSRFLKSASVFVNTTGIYTLPTRTIVIKQPTHGSTEPTVTSITEETTLPITVENNYATKHTTYPNDFPSSTTEQITNSLPELQGHNCWKTITLVATVLYIFAVTVCITCTALIKYYNGQIILLKLKIKLVFLWLNLVYFGLISLLEYKVGTCQVSSNIVIGVISFFIGIVTAIVLMSDGSGPIVLWTVEMQQKLQPIRKLSDYDIEFVYKK